MKYIESPDVYQGIRTSIFLAGGISNCPNWQYDIRKHLIFMNIVLLNPRRSDFVMSPETVEEQIKWEFDHLQKASMVLFWFPEETVCPIALYELGKQSVLSKPIFIGCHPNYSRIRDIQIQTKLARPEVEIVYSLQDLANRIKKELK